MRLFIFIFTPLSPFGIFSYRLKALNHIVNSKTLPAKFLTLFLSFPFLFFFFLFKFVIQ